MASAMGRAVFVALILLIFSLEWVYYIRIRPEAKSKNSPAGKMGINTEIMSLERTLLIKQKELVDLLGEINEKDVKLNYLNRENQKIGNLLGSYKSVLRKERELKEVEKFKESNLTSSVDSKKYNEQTTDKKVEQVIRITTKGREADTKVIIDAEKNEYILSSPNKKSSQEIDHTLLIDIGVLITSSAVSGLIASYFGQPIILGYLIGGSLVGPGCFGLINQFVQIETLAQLGATFLLFGLGVEFSIANLIRVRRVAIFGGLVQIVGVVIVTAATALSLGFQSKSNEAIFLGCVLAMSSTTMVVKGLVESNEINSSGGKITVGILVMQDLTLAVLLSILPVIASSGSVLEIFVTFLAKCVLITAVVMICRYSFPVVLGMLQSSKSHDILLLGVVSLCITMTMITEKILHSGEVGAFLSGMLINTAPKELAKKTMILFDPVRDIFAALFFSSIGMLINPAFLLEKYIPVSIMVLGVLVIKIILLIPIVRILASDVPGVDFQVSGTCAISLANIGEFAFVLANEGLGIGYLDEANYKVLLGSAAVSLLLSPLFSSVLNQALLQSVGEVSGKEKDIRRAGSSSSSDMSNVEIKLK